MKWTAEQFQEGELVRAASRGPGGWRAQRGVITEVDHTHSHIARIWWFAGHSEWIDTYRIKRLEKK